MSDHQGHIVFSCEASLKIGSGHVMRCLSLANFLRSKGFEVSFLTSQMSVDTVKALVDSSYTILSPETEIQRPVDWLIIDNYALDIEYERSARAWAHHILAIDDLANKQRDCNILLNQTYGLDDSIYKNLTNAQLLLGSDYCFLREDFRIQRDNLSRDYASQHAKRILVCFGGVNPKQATEKTLEYLNLFTDRALIIDVCVGGDQTTAQPIQTIIDRHSLHSITLHQNAQNMPEIMAKADLCIGAGGTMSWERCAIRLPTMTLEVADNQRDVLQQLSEAGAIHHLGKIEDITQDRFINDFRTLLNDSNALQIMSDRAADICDGRGIERVLSYLIKPEYAKDNDRISLRMVNSRDCKPMFEWQTEPAARALSRNPEPPSWDEHSAWFTNSLQCSKRRLYIIEKNGDGCGVIRVDRKRNFKFDSDMPTYEVSILVSSKYQGLGLGLCALKLLARLYLDKNLIAEINPANAASLATFKKAGYESLDGQWFQYKSVFHEKI